MTSRGADAVIPALSRADRLVLAGLFVALVLTPVAFLPQLYDDFTLAKQASLFVAAALVLAGLGLQGFPISATKPVRVALLCWFAILVLSELLAIDPRGSTLGVYQYRQGFATQVCYVVLFAGALRMGALVRHQALALALLAGTAGVFLYTAIQAVGADPVNWWTDTSARAFGTIGNANELAAFAIISLACCAAVSVSGRKSLAVIGAVTACASFIVFESESRSGLGALVLFVALVPVSWWVARNPLRELFRPGLAAVAGLGIGALLSLLAGGLAGTASRVQAGAAAADAGGSTRFALWKGTLEVIKSEPIHGAGPDGLFLAFPVHRPADLGGAFKDYDLVAQSSHNFVLDVAANYGLPGLLALAALFAFAAATAVKTVRSRPKSDSLSTAPWVWSAIAAYGALTLLNPASLAPQAAFFILLGSASGTLQPAKKTAIVFSSRIRAAAVAPAVGVALFAAILLPIADYRANSGWDSYAAKDFDAAAAHYDSASAAMPLERHYATEHARSLLAAGVSGPPQRLRAADIAFAQLDQDFGFTAGDAIGQATARIGLALDPSRINPVIDRAFALNPNGVFMERYTHRLRAALIQGATLHYSDRDRWVFVEANPPPESTSATP
ncbi:MAG: O-antigen ligase family protein [bacterium]